nr:MAG: hypothetical protein DIU68_08420 [Chloroflexota bacterium]
MQSMSGRSKLTNILANCGEISALVHETDWSATPFGPLEVWPPSLQTAASLCLCSRSPALIWWGPEFNLIYNDACRLMLGATEHPRAMGQPGRNCWPEIWCLIGPMLDQVYREGVANGADDQMLSLNRDGFIEERYFTFSNSPIFDESGGVGGVFTMMTETTHRVLRERRLSTLSALADEPAKAQTIEEACDLIVRVLAKNPLDVPFALLYLTGRDRRRAELAGTTGIAQDTTFSPATIDLLDAQEPAWPLAKAAASREPLLLNDLTERFPSVPQGPWPEPPERALVIPLPDGTEPLPAGFFIAGLSARLALDEEYRSFLERAARRIASAISNASALEARRKQAKAPDDDALTPVTPGETTGFSALTPQPAGETAARVLVVDPDASIRDELYRLLSERYIVELAAEGEQALAAARRQPPDMVISDVMLPGLDGLELLRALRGDPETQAIPVMLLSARAEEETRIEGLEAGADDFLAKPFSARELLARVEARLQIAQLQREKLAQEQAARLQTEVILESISDAFYTVDREWRFLYVNRRAEQLWGRDRGSLIGKCIWDEFPEGPSTAAYHMLHHAMQTRTTVQFETYSQFLDAWVEINIYPTENGLSVYFRDISERKRNEHALVESQMLIQRIANAIPDIVYVYDLAQDRVIYVNREIETSLGYRPEEVERMQASFFETTLHPQDIAAFRARAERFATAGDADVIEVEFRLRNVSGQWRWFHSRETIFTRREDGSPLSVVGSAQDITERRQVEEQARLLRAVNEALLDALTIEDVAEVIVSTVVGTMSGHIGGVYWLSDDGQTLHLLTHSTLPRAFREAFQRVDVNDDNPLSAVVRSGEPIWFENMARYVEDFPEYAHMIHTYGVAAGAIVPLQLSGVTRGAFAIGFEQARSFSEINRTTLLAVARQCGQALERALLHEAERQARRSAEAAQARLAFLADASAALVDSLDFRVTLQEFARTVVPTFADYVCIDLLQPSGEIERVCVRHANPELETLLARASATAPVRIDAIRGAGRVIRTGLTETDNRFGEAAIAHDIQDPVHQQVLRAMNVHSYTIAPLTARGRTFGAITFGSSLPDRYTPDDVRLAEEIGRRVALSVLNAQLFGDEQRARMQAEKADEMKLQFLGMVSHELRTPLASIKGFASTLLADDITLDAHLQRDFLEIIDQEADKLRDLIDQLLDLSRLEAGTLSIRPEPHAFREVLESAAAQLSAMCTEHRLILDVDRELPWVLVDRDRIAQVLVNLVSNATKHAPPATRITISAYPENAWLRIDVSDEGPGIPDEARDYIFEAFRQVETAHAKKGAGLGLAICKGLVERHGGRIWIADRRGPGATLSFTLPVVQTETYT